ncbi:hypothetical protein [Polycladidibacter hongkongensis]|uniref:hypothetical protein n=1 Tax=Polycladidibacter hongkongensis TaxID=1647556 RepID=UPI0008317A3B|nr:hypothetical protein [Pseudovibrio hongkongensis]
MAETPSNKTGSKKASDATAGAAGKAAASKPPVIELEAKETSSKAAKAQAVKSKSAPAASQGPEKASKQKEDTAPDTSGRSTGFSAAVPKSEPTTDEPSGEKPDTAALHGEPAQAKSSGVSAWVAGGLSGGFVGAVAAFALVASGVVNVQAISGDERAVMAGVVEANQIRLEKLEQQIAALETATPVSDAAQDAELDGQKGELEQRIQEIAKAFGSRIDAIRVDVAQLQEGQASAAPQGDAAPVADLQMQLNSVSGHVERLQSAFAAFEGTIAQLQADNAAQASEFAALQDQASASLDRNQAARALAVSSLQRAVEQGRPFETELTAVMAVFPEHAVSLQELEPFAKEGVASTASLIGGFDAVVRQMSRAQIAEEAAEEGFWGRLMGSAEQLVSVRRIDGSDMSDPRRMLGAMEQKVAKGDLAGALDLYDALPDEMRQAGAQWAGAVKARVQAADLMRQVQEQLISAMAAK